MAEIEPARLKRIPIPNAARRTNAPSSSVPKAIVFAWPDYSSGSPYFSLLYDKNAYGARYQFGSIETALQAIEHQRQPVPIVFHLHWLNWLFMNVQDSDGAAQKVAGFLASIAKFKNLGGHLIWTVHNELEHEVAFLKEEILLRDQLAKLSDRIHVHDLSAISRVKDYNVPMEKVVEVPHGHYIGVYPDTVLRREAREMLDLAEDDEVVLFAGRLGEYKGVEELVSAFRSTLKVRPRLRMVIAGQSRFGYDPFMSLAEPLSEGELSSVRFFKGFIEDDHLQVFFRAADLAVIPYRKALTSGSLMMALSFATPVVAADFPMIRSVLDIRGLGKTIPQPGMAAEIGESMTDLLDKVRTDGFGIHPDAHAEFEKRYQWQDFSVRVVKPTVEGRSAKWGL